MHTDTSPTLHWTDQQDQACQASWQSLAGDPPPKRVRAVDDSLPADQAYRLACEGVGLLWSGDFQNARLLLQAMGRRVDDKARRSAAAAAATRAKARDANGAPLPPASQLELFIQQRKDQALRRRVLGMLLLPFEADHGVSLRRAPDVREAGAQVRGPLEAPYVASLRELLGLIGAHEWRKNGVPVPALKASIHPHYGVFSPVRGEYVDLVAHAPLPPALKSSGKAGVAFDIGTGSGVLAAVLARRGVQRVLASDLEPRALACARANLQLLKVEARVQLVETDLFPEGQAQLIVCNPPWLPGRPSSALEHAVYDLDSRMLRGFLAGLAGHLAPGGEGWLILSDLAEHLGLRSREQLQAWIAEAGLQVLGRVDARPRHGRASDASDPLHPSRAAELTSLWRLALA